MNPTTGGLKELHQLHLKLYEHQQMLENGPRQIAATKRLVERKEQELEEHRSQLTELQKAADDRNLQFRTNEQKIEELKLKLNQAASNKEFDIIKGQIEADTAANAVLEDEYLEMLEQIDVKREELKELEQALGDVRTSATKKAAEVEANEPGLKQTIATVSTEIKSAEACVPTSLREDYRRLVAAHGPGAICGVDAGACNECFTELSPQVQMELRCGRVVVCRSCGRLLYLDEAE